MADHLHARSNEREDKRSLLRKIAEFLHPGPDSKDELIETLAEAQENRIIPSESREMLEGVIRMSEMSARDVMVPSGRMDMVNLHDSFEAQLNQIIDTGHSRFPVFEGERDSIVGILLAKDLLKLQRAPDFNVRALLRPPAFVPESKGLNDLLREFRVNHNHLALVVDEFGRVSGLITIEDVLEQIVGEIEDEFDTDEDKGDVFALGDGVYRVKGALALERLEEEFGVTLQSPDTEDLFDTIGGVLAHQLGHVPRKGERVTRDGLQFEALHTKGGVVSWFKVTVVQKPSAG